MRILLLVDDYIPHSTKIGAKMMHELAVALVKQNHDVSVATPDHRTNSKYVLDIIDKVEVYRFKCPNVKDESKLKRAINESLLSFYALKNLKTVFAENKFDLIIYYSPSIFFGPLVRKLKKKWNAKSFLILRDIFPQWVIDHGMIKEKSPIAAYFRKFEKLNYKTADKIGLQSPKNEVWFNAKFKLEHKTEVLYNWSNESPLDNLSNTYRSKLGLKNKLVFFYGGNMGEAQDMMNLVRLAKNLLPFKSAHFVFAGSGNEVDLIKSAILKNNLTNLTLLDPVDQEAYRKMLSEFDIGLFSLHKDHSTHNFPGKLLGYMAQGLPILGSVNTDNDVKEIINNFHAGMISINGEDQIFAQNAIKLIEDAELRKELSTKSYELLKSTFSIKSAIRTMVPKC
tara:strand:- start:423 stop:1610 length:1188 start_codon:yes stop_codon:yes gene_type:complete